MKPGQELARLRKEKGLTLDALAELAGTGPGYIWALEHGKLPGLRVSSKLARVLNVPLDRFWIKYKKLNSDTKVVENREKNSCWSARTPGIEILNLTPRSFKALYGAHIETVGELLLLTDKDLSIIRNLGPASLSEVNENRWH